MWLAMTGLSKVAAIDIALEIESPISQTSFGQAGGIPIPHLRYAENGPDTPFGGFTKLREDETVLKQRFSILALPGHGCGSGHSAGRRVRILLPATLPGKACEASP